MKCARTTTALPRQSHVTEPSATVVPLATLKAAPPMKVAAVLLVARVETNKFPFMTIYVLGVTAICVYVDAPGVAPGYSGARQSKLATIEMPGVSATPDGFM